MKWLTALLGTLFLLSGFNLFATTNIDRDFEAVHQYLNSKRTMDYIEKSENNKYLKLSGDVRTEWQHASESIDRINLRGRPLLPIFKDRNPISKNSFDIIFNFRCEYNCDRVWSYVNIEYDESAGVGNNDFGICKIDNQACTGSGECDDICLKRAFFGYNIWKCDKATLDVEFGRRPLYTIFDSRIEFQARFDGILFKFADVIKGWTEYYIKGGPFVVDYRVGHFAYCVELGGINIRDLGIDLKYSFIDWKKAGRNVCSVRKARGWQFRTSQWSLAYNFRLPCPLDKKTKIYAAILQNHAARKRELKLTSNISLIPPETIILKHKENLGWYAGFIIGEVKKKGDWSFDANYQMVQAQAIPDCDVHGIGRGNALRETFTATGRGKANYKGVTTAFLYAITDKLNFEIDYWISRAENARIGRRHNYEGFEIDIIYGF